MRAIKEESPRVLYCSPPPQHQQVLSSATVYHHLVFTFSYISDKICDENVGQSQSYQRRIISHSLLLRFQQVLSWVRWAQATVLKDDKQLNL